VLICTVRHFMGQVFQGDGASSTGSAPPREASTT